MSAEKKIDDGGAAFPLRAHSGTSGEMTRPNEGMTMRDYFAAAALQGIITKGTYGAVSMMSCGDSYDYERLAYIVADRMIRARKETT